jgi:hypothetical protein
VIYATILFDVSQGAPPLPTLLPPEPLLLGSVRAPLLEPPMLPALPAVPETWPEPPLPPEPPSGYAKGLTRWHGGANNMNAAGKYIANDYYTMYNGNSVDRSAIMKRRSTRHVSEITAKASEFGNSAKIIVPRSLLRKQVIAFLHSEYVSKHCPQAVNDFSSTGTGGSGARGETDSNGSTGTGAQGGTGNGDDTGTGGSGIGATVRKNSNWIRQAQVEGVCR